VADKPTYEELEQRVKELEEEAARHKQIEEALQESEKKYRSLFQSSFDGIAESGFKGNLIAFNSAFANMVGYSDEELKKLKCQDLTPLKWAEVDKKHVQQYIEKGCSDFYEKEHTHKDGTVFPVSIRIWLRKDHPLPRPTARQ
jgi:PAS domain S-box-containing protein